MQGSGGWRPEGFDFGFGPGHKRFDARRFRHVEVVEMRLCRSGFARLGGDLFQAVNTGAKQGLHLRRRSPRRRRAKSG